MRGEKEEEEKEEKEAEEEEEEEEEENKKKETKEEKKMEEEEGEKKMEKKKMEEKKTENKMENNMKKKMMLLLMMMTMNKTLEISELIKTSKTKYIRTGKLRRAESLSRNYSAAVTHVPCGCKASTLASRDEQHLRIFERRILVQCKMKKHLGESE